MLGAMAGAVIAEVAIRASAKASVKTAIWATIGAVTGVTRQKDRSAGEKDKGVIGRTRNSAGKRGGICTFGFAF